MSTTNTKESVVSNFVGDVNDISRTEKILLEIKLKVEGLENSMKKCRTRLKKFQKTNRRSLLEHAKKITTLTAKVKSLNVKFKKEKETFQKLENKLSDKNNGVPIQVQGSSEDLQESSCEVVPLGKENFEKRNKKRKKRTRDDRSAAVENEVTDEEIDTHDDQTDAKDGDSSEDEVNGTAESGDYTCLICEKSFNNFLHFQLHSHICQLSVKSHGCPICPEYFQDIQELYEHLEYHESLDNNYSDDCEENNEESYEIEQYQGNSEDEIDDVGRSVCYSPSQAHLSTEVQQENLMEQDEVSDSRFTDETSLTTSTRNPSRRKSERISKVAQAPSATAAKSVDPVTSSNTSQSEESDSLQESQNDRHMRKSSDEATPLQVGSQRSNKVTTFSRDMSASPSTYQCKTCSTVFPSRGSLHRHLNKVHPNAAASKCEECGIAFASQRGYLKHLSSCKHERRFSIKCRYCDYVTDKGSTMRGHLRLFGGKGPKATDFLRCSKCSGKFCSRMSLALHLKMKHVQLISYYKCSICNKLLSSERNLNHHFKVHKIAKDHKCSRCGNYFCTLNQLLKHADLCKSSDVLPNSIPNTPGKTAACCEEQEMSNSSAPSPKARSVRKPPSPAVLIECFDAENSEQKCQTCSKMFTSLEGLRRHMSAKHAEETRAAAPCKCDACNKEFPCQSQLSMHNCANPKNDGQKSDKKCPYCDYIPPAKHTLSLHLESRNKLRKLLGCLYCSNQFCTPASLLAHAKLIHRTSIYIKHQCFVCNVEFPNAPFLARHKKTCQVGTNDDSKHPKAPERGTKNSKNISKKPTPVVQISSTKKLASKIKKRLLKKKIIVVANITKAPAPPSNQPNLGKQQNLEQQKQAKSKGNYSCQVCEKIFRKKLNLIRHNRTHKILKLVPSIKYCCKFCKDTFSKWTEFESHVKVHSESQGICKTLPPSSRGRASRKKIKCSKCIKEFSNQDSMYSHFLVAHAWVKPFKCRQCVVSFCTGDGLKRHMKKSHPD